MGAEDLAAAIMGAGIEHIDNVNGHQHWGVGGWISREVVVGDKKLEGMSDGVDTIFDGDTKLASGMEVGSEAKVEVAALYRLN